ncbi:MAG: HEPN domain-containing protein [Bacteroidota bacterium]|nr:HEPN domain-containing protein [Bacteroidota bacterium]
MAQLAIKNNYWNSAASEFYYACFYLIQVLVAEYEIIANTHAGVKTLFGFHFIKEDKLEDRWGKLLTGLFNYRQAADYGDFITLSEQDILPLMNEVQEFDKIIRNLLAH